MKRLTNIVLSTLMALTLTTLTEGLHETYQIRHPHDDVTNNERQLSPLMTLKDFWDHARCRIKLRACRRVTKGQSPPLDAWEVRVSELSGGNISILVQTLQDVIAKARSVDMATVKNTPEPPTADAAEKEALLAEVRSIQAEAKAILKITPISSIDEVPNLFEKMQMMLNATSILTQHVSRQLPSCVQKILWLFFSIWALFSFVVRILCCGDQLTVDFWNDCDRVCVVAVFIPASIPGILLLMMAGIVFLIGYTIEVIGNVFFGQGRSSRNTGGGGTCSDNLLSCQYDSFLLATIPTSIDLVEQLG